MTRSTSPTEPVNIYIVGTDNLKNDLLRIFLEKETDLVCKCIPCLKDTIPALTNKSLLPQIILIDCSCVDFEKLLKYIETWKTNLGGDCFIALWGSKIEDDIEKAALNWGIKGIFYENDSPDTIRQGIIAIIDGQLWYPRKQTSQSDAPVTPAGAESNPLTAREKEILTFIVSENTTKQMANKLGISVYTVNTHISNIYRKLNVSNRLQAALWASKNLD